MLTSFVFGFDSDLIMRALLRLVCDEQPAWLLLPLQSMLSRLTVEHGQVLFYILVPLAVSTALAMNGPCLLPSPPPSHQLFQLIDIMVDAPFNAGDDTADCTSVRDEFDRDIVRDVIQVWHLIHGLTALCFSHFIFQLLITRPSRFVTDNRQAYLCLSWRIIHFQMTQFI